MDHFWIRIFGDDPELHFQNDEMQADSSSGEETFNKHSPHPTENGSAIR